MSNVCCGFETTLEWERGKVGMMICSSGGGVGKGREWGGMSDVVVGGGQGLKISWGGDCVCSTSHIITPSLTATMATKRIPT